MFTKFYVRLINFIKREDGINTVEVVIILAVVVGLALIFKKNITGYLSNIMGDIQKNSSWIG